MTRLRTQLATGTPDPKSAPLSFSAISPTRRAPRWFDKAARDVLIGFAVAALAPPCLETDACAKAASVAPHVEHDPYAVFIAEASERFHIPQTWLRAVLHVESAGNAHAVSPKGAIGLMQIMPDTWTQLRLHYHLGADPFDPHDNIIAGAAYLRELLDRFGASGFLAAYNAGPGRFEDYRAGLRPLHAETTAYLSKLSRLLPDLPLPSFSTDVRLTPDWQTASLFVRSSVMQPASAPAAQAPPQDRSADSASFASTPQSAGLFVPVAITQR